MTPGKVYNFTIAVTDDLGLQVMFPSQSPPFPVRNAFKSLYADPLLTRGPDPDSSFVP